MPNATSLSLYRAFLREVTQVRVLPLQRKLRYNGRALFRAYSAEKSPEVVSQLHADGAAAVRVLRWLWGLPEVIQRGGGSAGGVGLAASRASAPHTPGRRRRRSATAATRRTRRRTQEHFEELFKHYRHSLK